MDDYSVKKYFGGCPHDCPDTCAMVYEVENKKLNAKFSKINTIIATTPS